MNSIEDSKYVNNNITVYITDPFQIYIWKWLIMFEAHRQLKYKFKFNYQLIFLISESCNSILFSCTKITKVYYYTIKKFPLLFVIIQLQYLSIKIFCKMFYFVKLIFLQKYTTFTLYFAVKILFKLSSVL